MLMMKKANRAMRMPAAGGRLKAVNRVMATRMG